MAVNPGEVYLHKKRQSEYRVLACGAKLQMSSEEQLESLLSMTRFVVYQSMSDGSVWIRPEQEFTDGRFAKLES